MFLTLQPEEQPVEIQATVFNARLEIDTALDIYSFSDKNCYFNDMPDTKTSGSMPICVCVFNIRYLDNISTVWVLHFVCNMKSKLPTLSTNLIF